MNLTQSQAFSTSGLIGILVLLLNTEHVTLLYNTSRLIFCYNRIHMTNLQAPFWAHVS